MRYVRLIGKVGLVSVLLLSWAGTASAVEILSPNEGDTFDVDEVITFSARAICPTSEISWTFGDGETAKGATVTHSYDVADEYTVTASDPSGSDSITIKIGNTPPVAKVSADAYAKAVDEEFEFYSSGSEDPDGEIVAWGWEFGDGGTSDLESPKHAYDEPGTYTVTLTVTDNNGASGYASRDVTVVSNLSITKVTSEEQMILVGGYEDEKYQTAIYATVSPAVAGARVEFEFKDDSGQGVERNASFSPSYGLTDSTGRAETLLTSGDLVTVLKIVARCGGSSGQTVVKTVGLSGEIHAYGEDITAPQGGHTPKSNIVVPVGGTREFEGRQFEGESPLRNVPDPHHVTAKIIPEGQNIAKIVGSRTFRVTSDGSLNRKLLVRGVSPGTFQIELTIRFSKKKDGAQTFATKLIEVAAVGVVIVTDPEKYWPDNSKLLIGGQHVLTAKGLPDNKNWVYEWSFSRGGEFSENETYKAARTTLTAPAEPTAVAGWDEEKVTVLYYPKGRKEEVVKDERVLNITAPTKLKKLTAVPHYDLTKVNGNVVTHTTEWLETRWSEKTNFIGVRITYEIQDQKGGPISSSDRGGLYVRYVERGEPPDIKRAELGPLVYLVTTTPKTGNVITDDVVLRRVHVGHLLSKKAGTYNVQNNELLLDGPDHRWYAFVGGSSAQLPGDAKPMTHNTWIARVSGIDQRGRIQITNTYTIKIVGEE